MELVNGTASSITLQSFEGIKSIDLIDAFEAAYSSAEADIRAVGRVLGKGKKVKNLNTAVSSMELNLSHMRQIHEAAKKHFQEEAHWCCGKRKSTILQIGSVAGGWFCGVAAAALSIKTLQEKSQTDTTVNVLRSMATLTLGIFQATQGLHFLHHYQQLHPDEVLSLLFRDRELEIPQCPLFV